MKNFVSIIFVSLLLSGLCLSCKKNKGSSPQNCTLSAVTDSTTTLQSFTQFTYDNSGRISSVIVTGGPNASKHYYLYTGNMVVITIMPAYSVVYNEIDTVVLNSFGLIQTQTSYFPSYNSSSQETFFYDATGTVLRSIESLNGVPSDTDTYTTTNGDLNFDILSGDTTHNNDYFYSTQNIVYGDPTDLSQLLEYGGYYYKNKHLLSAISTAGMSYASYQYTITDGRIVRATSRQQAVGYADTVTHILGYSYSCK